MSIQHDVLTGWRHLWRRPRLVLALVLPLSLGIGATVAAYTVLEQILLAPLEFPQPQDLVSLRQRDLERDSSLKLSPANYLDLRDARGPFLDSIAAYRSSEVTLTDRGDPLSLDAVAVTPSFFEVLGVMPRLGRAFQSDMARVPEPAGTILDHGPHIILGHELWLTHFGGRQDVLGETAILDGRRLQIAGVMAAGFDFPAGVEVWLPLGFGDLAPLDRGGFHLEVIGRLRAGVTLEEARTHTDLLAERLRETAPRINDRLGLSMVPLAESLVENLELNLWLLFGTSALILLLVSANAAQLFLAQSLARQRELAMRLALGAQRASVVCQLLVESLSLALAATGLGLIVARGGLQALLAAAPPELLAGWSVSLDQQSLLFSLLVGALVGLLVGLAPSWYLSRSHALRERLSENPRAQSQGRGQTRFQDSLVIAQLALAVVLVHSTYLMVHGYRELRTVPLGFEPKGVLTAEVMLPERYGDPASKRLFVDQVLDQLEALPGVSSAGVGLRLPVVDSAGGIWFLPQSAGPSSDLYNESYPVTFHVVTPGYLLSLGIPLMRGRNLEHRDHATAVPVAVINRRLAEDFFADSDPVGKTLTLTPWPDKHWTIVGISEDMPQGGLKSEAVPAVFVPFHQVPMGRLRLVAKVDGEPTRLLPALQAAIWRVDPNLGIRSAATLGQRLSTVLLPDRFSMTLIGLYGLFGAVLVALGIFSVTALFVNSRRAEIAIRLAIGGRPIDVLGWVVRRSLLRLGLGVGLGVVGAFAVVSWNAVEAQGTFLSWSALSLCASGLSLGLVVALAHYLPTRRAVGLDPAAVLRA